jgi:hypothetical protein
MNKAFSTHGGRSREYFGGKLEGDTPSGRLRHRYDNIKMYLMMGWHRLDSAGFGQGPVMGLL